jgi:hypothetical protein
MKRIAWCTIAAVLALALPGTSRAQQADARLEAALEAAARARIPVALLESKIAEGRAKRVPPDRIAAAVEARLEALIEAQGVLAQAGLEAATSGELSIAADALQANVGQDVVVKILRSAPEDRRVVATAVLTQLVQLGYEPESAFLRVNTALAGGAEALANLRAEAAAALRIRGMLPLDGGLPLW